MNRRAWRCPDCCWWRRWWTGLGSWPTGRVQAPCPGHQTAQFGKLVRR